MSKYRRGEIIHVRRGTSNVVMVVVAAWARGEGDGCVAKLPHQRDDEGVDVPARRIVHRS